MRVKWKQYTLDLLDEETRYWFHLPWIVILDAVFFFLLWIFISRRYSTRRKVYISLDGDYIVWAATFTIRAVGKKSFRNGMAWLGCPDPNRWKIVMISSECKFLPESDSTCLWHCFEEFMYQKDDLSGIIEMAIPKCQKIWATWYRILFLDSHFHEKIEKCSPRNALLASETRWSERRGFRKAENHSSIIAPRIHLQCLSFHLSE